MDNSNIPSTFKYDFLSFCIRMGKIFSNMSIICLVLCFVGVVSFISTAIILLIGLTLILVTIGTIFVLVPNYWDKLTSASRISAEISSFFLEHASLFITLTIILSIISLILLLVDRRERPVARIVISSIVVVLAIIVAIIIALGVI